MHQQQAGLVDASPRVYFVILDLRDPAQLQPQAKQEVALPRRGERLWEVVAGRIDIVSSGPEQERQEQAIQVLERAFQVLIWLGEAGRHVQRGDQRRHSLLFKALAQTWQKCGEAASL